MNIKDYKWEDLDLAPRQTGIYAWYLIPVLRNADLKDSTATTENLLHIARQLKLPTFDVKAYGHLSLFLRGSLEHEHSIDNHKEGFTELVRYVLNDESKRQIFAKILTNSVPHLMSPLYIGVATDLWQRLQQHKRDINYYRELIRKRPNMDDHEDEKHKFALEVVKRGIPNRMLSVFITTIDTGLSPSDDFRMVSEAVETVLNRLFYPIMGRR